jgi:hypothetical protein
VAAQAAGGELGGGWRLPSRLIASDVQPVETLSEMRLVVSDGLAAHRARVIAQCFGVGRGALPPCRALVDRLLTSLECNGDASGRSIYP